MINYSGACQCGRHQFELQLPKPLSEYVPRRCDCDFCTSRSIEYISDPNARLLIAKKSINQFKQQGSDQAKFLECDQCKTMFSVIYEQPALKSHRFGAVNYNCLLQAKNNHPSQTVSPKLLSAEEKHARWQEIWCPVIAIE